MLVREAAKPNYVRDLVIITRKELIVNLKVNGNIGDQSINLLFDSNRKSEFRDKRQLQLQQSAFSEGFPRCTHTLPQKYFSPESETLKIINV